MDPLLVEDISNRVLYTVGESFVLIGLFITIVGAVTMIYSMPIKGLPL